MSFLDNELSSVLAIQLQYKRRNDFDGSIKAENLTKKKEIRTEIIIIIIKKRATTAEPKTLNWLIDI